MYAMFLIAALAAASPGQLPPAFEGLVQAPCPCLCPPPGARVHVARAAPRDPVLTWNEAALEAIRAERTPPPLAARNLAIVHVAVYDSVHSILATHDTFRFRADSCGGESPEAAAAVAAHRALCSLYPRQAARLDDVLDDTLAVIPEGERKRAGIALGQAVAERVLAWRAGDAAALRTSYTPSSVAGRWRPTLPDHRAALMPHWSTAACFAMRTSAQFRPSGPPPLDSDAFAASFNQVKALGGVDSAVRTREQAEIARFWADGDGTVTPPGHWNRIAQTVAAQRGHSMSENARLFAMLNVALADAAIACWECKYGYDFWRPVTAIREADRLNAPALAPDPSWRPLLTTPPFPAYTSGHSTFSAAAAAVLGHFFGTDHIRFTTTAEDLPGVRRTFSSFRAAAEEAGMSRIYGGIHWDFDNRDGLAMGQQVGDYVATHFFRPRVAAERGPAVRLAFERR